ncbi:hypothetical protein [Novosphingobium subterraneum]|uniref:Uncharacterized protein n=1 Tax=Novosphingobium subterraneum TaxID=48936 RepID=A0A0B9A1K8_9SPHN|nr:hypothetical protein [Novosphingobium subterraneum]KHS43233.1 hypothetical protein NJ75_03862 [Novosphingobium subterraneum]
MPHAADPHQPSSFGRGWIPASRDIGLPDDALPAVGTRGWGRVPLPQAGGERLRDACPPAGGGRDGTVLPHGEEQEASLLHPNQFTPTRIALFLEHLSRHGQVRAAAQVAGVSSQTAYVRRRRDPAFAAAWDAALLHAREAAEQVLATRALHGTTETIWFRGEAVGERRRFDARLLLAHLARLDARAAQAPREIHHLAEDFDRMLLALAEGADVAAATGFADPAQDRFLKACEKQAEQDFKRAVPYPTDDEPDEAWDDWQEAHDAHMESARQLARESWSAAQNRREATLQALFGEEEDKDQTEIREACSPAQAGASVSLRNEREKPEAVRKPAEVPACAGTPEEERGEQSAPEPCKPRKPLGLLRCGTSPSALLSAGLNWPIQAPRQLPATPVPLPPAPAQPCFAAVTGHSW